MAKKTSSVHIETSLWDYIDEYQKKNKITSRNTAIEWMLVEHRNYTSNKNIKETPDKDHENTNEIENIKSDQNKKIQHRESDAMLKQMFDSMED